METSAMSRLAVFLICPLLGHAAPAAASAPVVSHSSIAFTLQEKDLLPENLAYDPQSGDFFVGSTRKGKILRVSPGCHEQDFVTARAYGLWQVIGMKADPRRRLLWVLSSDGDNLVGYKTGNGSPAGLFKFDLDDGKLLARYVLDEPGVVHFLNDLVLTPQGDVYVTHMFDRAQVWRLDARTGTFAPFYAGDTAFHDPNGIALSADGKRLYVADEAGISAIDTGTRARTPLTDPAGFGLGGVDGLYVYGRALVFLQPDLKRVARCELSADGLTAEHCAPLELNNPLFDHITTGVVVGNSLFYIANSQFDRVGAGGTLPPLDQLYQPVILKLDL
jgi:sugar lactone lactonase YvrE